MVQDRVDAEPVDGSVEDPGLRRELCGQLKPTGFSPRTRSLCPYPGVRRANDVPDPDGPLGYEVITRLARGEQALEIARNMDLTLAQVDGLRAYVHTAANMKVGEYR